MQVELLLVPGCPSGEAASELLRAALADIGLAGQEFTTTVISDQADAERRGFVGSPTLLIDGVDPFPTVGQRPGLACRIYDTESGRAPVPSLARLRVALRGVMRPTGAS